MAAECPVNVLAMERLGENLMSLAQVCMCQNSQSEGCSVCAAVVQGGGGDRGRRTPAVFRILYFQYCWGPAGEAPSQQDIVGCAAR